MNRTLLFPTTALFGLAGAAAAGPLTTPPRCSSRAPLYDQDGRDGSGIGIISQNFESGFGVCQDWTAENVCVPDGQGDHIFTLR